MSFEHRSECEPPQGEVEKNTAKPGERISAEYDDMPDMQPNEFSPYRESLSVRGLVDIRTYGKITFRLPRFKEFVLNKMRFELY